MRVLSTFVLAGLLASAAHAQTPVVHHVPMMVHDGRIYINGSLSGKKVLLLVDTGATVSTFPYRAVPKHDSVQDIQMRTAAGTMTCARVESSVDLEAVNESAPVRTLVGGMYCSVSKFGNADGLLGADVLLNGRYSSISFDFTHNELLLTEKQ